MKLNDLALILILFIIISFILSAFNLISFSLPDILSYSLLVSGIALVYTEIIRQNRLLVFLGSAIFLIGVYFLITENFTLNFGDAVYIPLILIIGGSGLLMLYISTATQKIFLYISIIFLTAGITLIIANSHWELKTFFLSISPVFNFLWPVTIIFVILIFLMRIR